MGDSTWYRGTAIGVQPAPAGTVYHDFGEGVYLTDTLKVAKMYAETRADGLNSKAVVYEVKLDLSRMNVWDLRKDAAFQNFLKQGGATFTNEDAMRLSTKGYSEMFQFFVKSNKLQARYAQADVIIGPELIRGGMQMCILHKGGRPSRVAQEVLPQLRLIWAGGKNIEPVPAPRPPRSNGPGPGREPWITANHPLRQKLGDQSLMTGLGQELINMNMRNMDANIFRAAEQELNGRLAKQIQQMLARGEGVLAIICAMQTRWTDGAGQQFRIYYATYLQSGPDPDTAAQRFHNTPSLVATAENQDRIYYYRWYPPHIVY
jgi:hypothetical protein